MAIRIDKTTPGQPALGRLGALRRNRWLEFPASVGGAALAGLLLAPCAHVIAIEITRSEAVGPTVDLPRLDEPYVLGVLAVGFLLTPIFNAARGSLLIAGLYHFHMSGPAWPEAQPWENYLFAALAVVVVVVNRKTMLARAGAPNEVLFPGDELPAAPVQ